MNLLFIISSGPGSLCLIPIKSLLYIYYSNFIFFDSLINLGIINYSNFNSKKLLIGKRFNQFSILKKTIYVLLFISYLRYNIISKLKSGDVNFFSRINNEIIFYKYNFINYIINAGITTLLSTFCNLKWFLTIRFKISTILFITYFNNNLLKLNKYYLNKTIIYYMINNNIKYLINIFINENFFFHFCLIENCNFLNEYIYIFNMYDYSLNLNYNFFYYDSVKILISSKLKNYININNLFIILY